MACRVESRRVASRRVLSCRVTSWHVMARHVCVAARQAWQLRRATPACDETPRQTKDSLRTVLLLRRGHGREGGRGSGAALGLRRACAADSAERQQVAAPRESAERGVWGSDLKSNPEDARILMSLPNSENLQRRKLRVQCTCCVFDARVHAQHCPQQRCINSVKQFPIQGFKAPSGRLRTWPSESGPNSWVALEQRRVDASRREEKR